MPTIVPTVPRLDWEPLPGERRYSARAASLPDRSGVAFVARTADRDWVGLIARFGGGVAQSPGVATRTQAMRWVERSLATSDDRS